MIFFYYLAFFLVCFVLPSIRVFKKTGINPIVFKGSNSAHDLIGFYMKLIILSCLMSGLEYSGFLYINLEDINLFLFQKGLGVVLMVLSFVWVVIAQSQMAESWRIGIDSTTNIKLVKKGLFKFSRNPIFLGMMVSLLGVMLVAMNTLNVFNFILTYFLISIQIRLEEEYLNKAMKDEYSQYCILTPRWLGFRK